MHRNLMKPVFLLPILALFFTVTTAAQGIGVEVGEIEFDSFEWGSRHVYIPVDNLVDDTAYVNVTIHTIYPKHYLSGLERLEMDTTIAVAPKDIEDMDIPVTIHGSFERVVTRVMVFWRYNNYEIPPNVPDSTFQIFNNVFRVSGDATKYSTRKHGLGPVYSVMDYYLMNFEYPRLVLFLLARGESAEDISALFEADSNYTRKIIAEFRSQGLFPYQTNDLTPGIMAIAEYEGYLLKPALDSLALAFSGWYTDKGRGQMKQILIDAGLDPYVSELPSLQIPILMTLLKENWIDPEHGVDVARFEDEAHDLKALNHPLWIVQGGEFFLPKLCLAAFDEQGRLHFGTFSPDPTLPYDKATIYDFRKEVEENAGSIILVEAAQIRLALDEARKQKLAEPIIAEIKALLNDEKTQQIFEFYQPIYKPHLADYLCRMALGAALVEHKPADGLDCIKVRY